MGLHAGKGQVVHQNVVHTLSRYITNADLSGVYELGYELNNRPEWLEIPGRALLKRIGPLA